MAHCNQHPLPDESDGKDRCSYCKDQEIAELKDRVAQLEAALGHPIGYAPFNDGKVSLHMFTATPAQLPFWKNECEFTVATVYAVAQTNDTPEEIIKEAFQRC